MDLFMLCLSEKKGREGRSGLKEASEKLSDCSPGVRLVCVCDVLCSLISELVKWS